MFPEPPRQPLKLSGQFKDLVGGKVTYSPYQPKARIPCDECLWTLHLNKGAGEPARTARHRRRIEIIQRGQKHPLIGDLVLCYEHCELWRKIDGK